MNGSDDRYYRNVDDRDHGVVGCVGDDEEDNTQGDSQGSNQDNNWDSMDDTMDRTSPNSYVYNTKDPKRSMCTKGCTSSIPIPG